MFARKIDDGLTGLVKRLDSLLVKNAKREMYATVVMLSADRKALSPKLEALAKEHGIAKVPLTIADDGEAGPEAYKLSKDVAYTLVVYDASRKVVQSFAHDTLDEAAVKAAVKLFAETAKVEVPGDEKK